MNYRYFIQLSYNGKAYCGWQVQPNASSVQEVLTRCLSALLGECIEVVGAGRTDAGVHAKMMIAHFDTSQTIAEIPLFVGKLNSFLPHDIAIQKLYQVKSGAHARFDALNRKYEYQVSLSKDVFARDFSMRVPFSLDIDKMNRAAALLFHYRDFTSFSKLHTDVKTNNCTITTARWERREEMLVFTIGADRFLRNMVRAIVGTLLDVGRGKIDVGTFEAIIQSKNRGKAGSSVPAQGLYLVDVAYPSSILL